MTWTITLNYSEMLRVMEALTTETKDMRKTVAAMNDDAIHNDQHCHENTIGAREVLAELESLCKRFAVNETLTAMSQSF